jgi:hypothetical protein
MAAVNIDNKLPAQLITIFGTDEGLKGWFAEEL